MKPKSMRSSLRRAGVVAVLAAAAAAAPARLFAQAPAPTPTPTLPPPEDPARAQRLAWFKQAKYGMFIHFGLYAIPAGEWKGKTIPGIGEFFARLIDRFAMRLASSIADEVELRTWDRFRF